MSAEAYLDVVMSIWAERHEKTTCPIRGDCMSPLIRQGDVLTIEHGECTLRIGDILIFKKDDDLLAHRLVYVEKSATGDLLYTKGDRSLQLDSPISVGHVQGKVIEASGSNGRLCFSSPFWRIISRVLALLSHATARDRRAGRFMWRILRVLGRLRSIIAPRSSSFRDIAARLLCAVYRATLGRQGVTDRTVRRGTTGEDEQTTA